MEEGEAVSRKEAHDLISQMEERFQNLLQQRIYEVERSFSETLHLRIQEVESKLPSSTSDVSCWHEVLPVYQKIPDEDIELPRPKARRLVSEAAHAASDGGRYMCLCAREMSPRQEVQEGPAPEDLHEIRIYSARDLCAGEEDDAQGDAQGDVDDARSDSNAPGKFFSQANDLPQNAWGSATLCIIEEIPNLVAGNSNYAQALRTTFAMSCLFLNIVFQSVALWFVGDYVANPAVAKLQTLYKKYHQQCFDESGAFLEDMWHRFEYRRALCEVTFTEPVFISLILMIWCIRMLGEFRAVLYQVRHIEAVETVSSWHLQMVIVQTEVPGTQGIVREIVGLTTPVRVCIYICVIIPQLFINLCLTWLGMRWLAATDSFPSLILNALALQFIIDFDELMLASLFPERMIRALDSAKLVTQGKRPTTEGDLDDMKSKYHGAIFWLCFLFVIVYAYLYHLQQVLPGFMWDIQPTKCNRVRQEVFSPQCHHLWQADCFPFGGHSGISLQDTKFDLLKL